MKCSKCKQETDDFSPGNNNCRPCHRIMAKAHYHKNKESIKKRVAIKTKRNVALIRDAKAKPCTDCGIQYDYWIMQFDHVRGKKKFQLSSCRTYSTSVIEAELDKCEVVCANCHADRTYKRQLNT